MDGGELDIALQSAVLFPSPDNPLSDLLSDPPEIQNLTLTSLPSDSLPLSSLHAGKEGTAESGSSERGEQKVTFYVSVNVCRQNSGFSINLMCLWLISDTFLF